MRMIWRSARQRLANFGLNYVVEAGAGQQVEEPVGVYFGRNPRFLPVARCG